METVKIYTKEQIQSIWNNFKEEIKHENRFFFNQSILTLFENFFLKNKCRLFSTDTKMTFYRARKGSWLKKDDKEILEAPAKSSNAGRCNPRGISYLYAALETPTAIAELRLGPEMNNQKVTVAELEIDMGNIFSFLPYNKPYMQKAYKLSEEEIYFINMINTEFSKFVVDKNKLDYLPLQYVAEYIKYKGFDGFIYSSTVHQGGINLVLFNKEKRKVLSKSEYILEVKKHKFSYK